MKWKLDWLDIAETVMIAGWLVAVAAMFTIFFVYVWKEETTARTIIITRDGSQSYACTISDISPNPHDCKPIKDTEE